MTGKYPILVRPVHGENLERYYATSATAGPDHHYLVDLNAYYGHGWCNCPTFQARNEPHIKNAQAEPADGWTNDQRCKHIKAVRKYFGQELVDAFLRHKRQQRPKQKDQL